MIFENICLLLYLLNFFYSFNILAYVKMFAFKKNGINI